MCLVCERGNKVTFFNFLKFLCVLYGRSLNSLPLPLSLSLLLLLSVSLPISIFISPAYSPAHLRAPECLSSKDNFFDA